MRYNLKSPRAFVQEDEAVKCTIMLEIDYELMELHEAIQDKDNRKIIEVKRKLKKLTGSLKDLEEENSL